MICSRRTESTVAKGRQRRLRFEQCEPRLLLSRETVVVSLNSSVITDIDMGASDVASLNTPSIVDGRVVQQHDDARRVVLAGVAATKFVQYNHSTIVLTREAYLSSGFSADWTRISDRFLFDDDFDVGMDLSALQGGAEKIARIIPIVDPNREPVREPGNGPSMQPATDPAVETVSDAERPQFLDLAGIWESMSEKDIDETFAKGRNNVDANYVNNSSLQRVSSPGGDLTRVGSADALGRASFIQLAGAPESTTPEVKLASRSIIRQVVRPAKIASANLADAARTLLPEGEQHVDASGGQPVDESGWQPRLVEPAETLLIDSDSSRDDVERPGDASPPRSEPLSRAEPVSHLWRSTWLAGGLIAFFGVDRYLRRNDVVVKSPPDA